MASSVYSFVLCVAYMLTARARVVVRVVAPFLLARLARLKYLRLLYLSVFVLPWPSLLGMSSSLFLSLSLSLFLSLSIGCRRSSPVGLPSG